MNKHAKNQRKKFFTILLFLGIAGFFLAIITLVYALIGLPDVRKITQKNFQPAVTLLDINGEMLARLGDGKGDDVTYDEIPAALIQAVTATEDRRFFEHGGIDFRGIARAMLVNIRHGRIVEGGSTITQQLAKILFLNPDRNLKRKLQEALLSLYLEHKFSKKQIISLYLNRVYLGAGNYGASAAARYYFDKSVRDLNRYEAAVIAGLLKAPSRYAPTQNPLSTRARTEEVLKNMVEAGHLSKGAEAAVRMRGDATPFKQGPSTSALYAADWIMEQLPSFIGEINSPLIVETSIDSKWQNFAELAFAENLKKFPENERPQVALVAMAKDGAVRALIGGRDYRESQFNRAIQAKRQPGSAFKFAVYASAFEAGLSPNDIREDAPIRIGKWQPENFDHKYRGDVTLSEAFAFSINTVAVRLAKEIGIGEIINLSEKLGVESPIKPDLSSALGSSVLSPLELATMYAHIPSRGFAVWPYAITKISKENGEIIYAREAGASNKILSAHTVQAMEEILARTITEGTGKAANPNRAAGGKTGTSQDFRDAWFAGVTPEFTAVIWYGRDDNKPMPKISGGTLPATSWRIFAENILAEMPEKNFGQNIDENNQQQEAAPFWERLLHWPSDDESEIKTKPKIEYKYPGD
jgi:penicillin-binding protein 1A